MSLVLTAADVHVFGEAARLVGNIGQRCVGTVASLRSAVPAAGWRGDAAAAADTAAHALAARFDTASRDAGRLAASLLRAEAALSAELARRRAVEHGVINELGRLAALPGDAVAEARQVLGIASSFPVTGSALWDHVSRSLTRLLP